MADTSHLKISFIIASIDRDLLLQKCISSIEKAHEFKKDIPVEILVVVQKTKQKKDIQVLYPENTVIYYIDEIGLSVARNFAIEKSKGDYLVFIDDDAAVKEDFIEVLSKNISGYDKVNAFCGRLIDSVQDTPFSHLFRNNKDKELKRTDYQYFMGSGHVLSRQVLNRIGYYDRRFGVGAKYYGSEESDIFFRLKAVNERVIYLPGLVFFHPIPVMSAGYVYKYAYAVGAVLTKSCINDKAFFIVYCGIVFKITFKAFIRILQKMLFKGIYEAKDKKYHYSSLLSGTFMGIKDFIANEL